MKRRVVCLILLPAPLLVNPPEGAPPPPGPGLGNCTTAGCHDDLRDAPGAHRPVAEGVCKICHQRVDAETHQFRLAREGGRLCVTCHREMDAQPDANAHSRLWPDGCTLCHDPHGTGHPFLLTASRVARSCEECHASVIEDPDTIHLPVAGLRCTTCHDPHGALAVQPLADGESTCFGCHQETRAELTSEFVHEPVRTGSCDQCHGPHDMSSAPLRDEIPALCYGCHEEIRATVETAPYVHSAASQPDGCVRCHAAHASREENGLLADPLTLCNDCHRREMTARDGSTIAAVALEIEESKYLHGPVRQNDCSACHDSHGGEHAGLLVANYTTEFYASFDLENFQLCISCHPERGRLTERTSRLTEFRNGDLNLHYLHVNKTPRGRTCRACHATHGSNTPKHIRDEVKYGQWQLPVAFTPTETGGRCQSGCHVERAYDREVPVPYERAGDLTAPR